MSASSETINYRKGLCYQCGGHIEFPEQLMGGKIDCPHCGAETYLLSGLPGGTRKPWRWLLIGLVIAVAAVALALGIKTIKGLNPEQMKTFVWTGFACLVVALATAVAVAVIGWAAVSTRFFAIAGIVFGIAGVFVFGGANGALQEIEGILLCGFGLLSLAAQVIICEMKTTNTPARSAPAAVK